MASTHLSRTPATGQTSRTKGTLSVWLKRAKTDEEDFIFNGFESSSNQIKITFKADGKLQINSIQSGSNHLVYETNRLFRDTSAWYNIVIAIDTTLATAGDRCRLYVNGVEETSFSTETHFSQNDLSFLTEDNRIIYIGSQQGTANYFDGSMSHFHLIDGTQYDASYFGETDSTTGEWKIKTSPSVTYGNHGFFILKDGNSVTDQSGNGNNLTVGGGTLTNTEDCPSNVFCTINPLDNYYGGGTFSNGNTKIQTGAVESYTTSTLGASSGKFYCEMKLVSSTSTFKTRFGVAYEPTNSTSDWLGKRAVGWSYREDGLVTNNNSSVGGTWSSYTAGDIIGMAFNLDDLQGGLHKLYFSKNGVWQNGADPSNHSSVTGVVGITDGETYLVGIGDETGGYSVCEFNFGNGYFGTTAVSSAGTNASGNGIFEYDVPTGYTALSTKGLNL